MQSMEKGPLLQFVEIDLSPYAAGTRETVSTKCGLMFWSNEMRYCAQLWTCSVQKWSFHSCGPWVCIPGGQHFLSSDKSFLDITRSEFNWSDFLQSGCQYFFFQGEEPTTMRALQGRTSMCWTSQEIPGCVSVILARNTSTLAASQVVNLSI